MPLTVLGETSQWCAAGTQAGLKGPVWFHSHTWCWGGDNSAARTSSSRANVWPFPVAWLPDSTACHSNGSGLHRTSVPASKMEVILPFKTQLQSYTTLFSSYSIGQNSHKSTHIQGEQNYTPILEGGAARSHPMQKSMWDRRYCRASFGQSATVSKFTDDSFHSKIRLSLIHSFLKMPTLTAGHHWLR